MGDNIDDPQTEPESPHVKLPIEFHFPDGIRTIFANNMLAQQDETDIFLSFFELTPPVFTDVNEAKVKLTAMGSVRATCVAKIAISKARVPGLIRAIQSQLDGESPVQQVDGV